jgi:tRNA(Ile)-lysidine synthase
MARARGLGLEGSVGLALRDRLVGVDDLELPTVVGCSGGPDSLALLALAASASLGPIAVHVDHGLRPDSDQDARAVAHHADMIGVQFHAESVKVEPGPNLEARARDARYAALERARAAFGASATLVAHTADDQAETVVLNLLRGSGAAGLAGMSVRRDSIVRPLLGLRRADTERLCEELGFEPVRDPSNDDRSIRRNWVRHDVLPLLANGAERDLVPVLARQAAILREESEYLDSLARASWPADGHRLGSTLTTMPAPLARRAVRIWLGPPPPSSDEVERVLAVARGDVRAAELTGGRRVWRREGRLNVGEQG